MSLIEDLLAICRAHGVYVQLGKRWLVALGGTAAVGETLPEAVEHWCQEVERRGIVRKDKEP